ncbi:GntR family transcriptional regulator [Corynebacterium timonense]|uniref:DNA-binding transcriptional regulator YhcF, GntR family n=1 Tax=Corynebacterium timonense TaxID=441500 RepID=A0A1H1UVQ4_9CORY|nr:GntR family transcriptional regulator [Corynebacterium timonense]SDS76351.1 DNA-binding transcriptional regulator YhcF, GntR family [Corynebacterium timonense]
MEPLFTQVAWFLEDLIVDGSLAAGARTPSTNELAAFHGINAATARRGIALLVDDGVLHTRRGLGTFVTPDARDIIVKRRRELLPEDFVAPLIDESLRLGYDRGALVTLVEKVAESRGMYR